MDSSNAGAELASLIAAAAPKPKPDTMNEELQKFLADNGFPSARVTFASCTGGTQNIYDRLNQEKVQDSKDLSILLLKPGGGKTGVKDPEVILEAVIRYIEKTLKGIKKSRQPKGPIALAQEDTNGGWSVKAIIGKTETPVSAFVGEIHHSRTEYLGSASLETLSLAEVNKILEPRKLRFSNELVLESLTALRSGKHVLLTGPPGSGKTSLALALADAAAQCNVAESPLVTTGTADWSSVETVGAYRLMGNQGLRFEPGCVLQSMDEGRWLVIDELNRADIDKAIGQIFTVLSGHAVTLPFLVAVDEGAEDPDAGEDQIPDNGQVPNRYLSVVPPGTEVPESTSPIHVPDNWRLIATMNDRDQDLLFTLSEALMRRFAVIPVDPPDTGIWEQILQDPGGTGLALWDKRLLKVVEVLASMGRPLGPAVILALATHLKTANQIAKESNTPIDGDKVFISGGRMYVHPQLRTGFGPGGIDISEAALKRVLEPSSLAHENGSNQAPQGN
jgi:MoxR-like ATPase